MLQRFSITDCFRIAFVLFLGWLTLITAKDGPVLFFQNLDLIFHEAGHVIIFFLGDVIQAFGGTLGQLAIPALFTVYFFFRLDLYASAVMGWWFGENLMNVSIYVGDARAHILPILGGEEAHDWTYLLGRIGVLEYDTAIANVLWTIGIFVMIAALLIAALTTFTANKNQPQGGF